MNDARNADKLTMGKPSKMLIILLLCLASCAGAIATRADEKACPAPDYDPSAWADKLVEGLVTNVGSISNAREQYDFGKKLATELPESCRTKSGESCRTKALEQVASGLQSYPLRELAANKEEAEKLNLLGFFSNYAKIDPYGAKSLQDQIAARTFSEQGGAVFTSQIAGGDPAFAKALKLGLQNYNQSPTPDFTTINNLVNSVNKALDFVALDDGDKKSTLKDFYDLLAKNPDNINFYAKTGESDPFKNGQLDASMNYISEMSKLESNLRRQGYRPDYKEGTCEDPTSDTQPTLDSELIKTTFKTIADLTAKEPLDSPDAFRVAHLLRFSPYLDQIDKDSLKFLDRQNAVPLSDRWDIAKENNEDENWEPEEIAKVHYPKTPQQEADEERLSAAAKILWYCHDEKCEGELEKMIPNLPTENRGYYYGILMQYAPEKESVLDAAISFYQNEVPRGMPVDRLETDEHLTVIYDIYLKQPCMTFAQGLMKIKDIKDAALQSRLELELIKKFDKNLGKTLE